MPPVRPKSGQRAPRCRPRSTPRSPPAGTGATVRGPLVTPGRRASRVARAGRGRLRARPARRGDPDGRGLGGHGGCCGRAHRYPCTRRSIRRWTAARTAARRCPADPSGPGSAARSTPPRREGSSRFRGPAPAAVRGTGHQDPATRPPDPDLPAPRRPGQPAARAGARSAGPPMRTAPSPWPGSV
jgi:hypothetical protein